MRTFNIVLIGLTLNSLSSLSYADGNSLLEKCLDAEYFLNNNEVRNQLNVGYCTGVVQGVMNTLYIFEEPISTIAKICWPKTGTDSKQAVRIITKYLKKNPEILHQNEFGLVVQAFSNSFACE